MTLMDFFVPKWRHSNPEVRITAVRSMTSEKMDDLDRIARTDPAADVRMAAIRQIEDSERLEAIADSIQDDAVKAAARDRLDHLYHDRLREADDRTARIGLVDKLTDENRLAEIAADIPDPDIRMAALNRITRPLILCRVAESQCGPAVGGAVVNRLTDPELLKRLTRSASNKKVRKSAEKKLATLSRTEAPEADRIDELAACCSRLEGLLADGDWPAYPPALAEAQTIWTEQDPEGVHPLRERFQRAAEAIQAEVEICERKGEAQAALEALCAEAEGLPGGDSPEAVQEGIHRIRNRWEAIDGAVVPAPLFETLSARFREALQEAKTAMEGLRAEKDREAREREDRLDALSRLCRAAEELVARADETVGSGERAAEWEALERRWREQATEDPSEAPLTERFDAAREKRREVAERAAQKAGEAIRKQEAELYALCEQVEAAVEATDRAGLEKTVRSAQAEWKTAGDRAPETKAALSERFRIACDRFFTAQRTFWEKTEWERFANLTQKEELCVIVEALAENGVVNGLPEMVREVQNRWKAIGPVSREKAASIRNRFQTACDNVYTRCRGEKETLAAEARDLVEGVPEPEGFASAAEWEQVADALKMIQARWKAIGPLPRALEKLLFETFQSRCNDFFERRRQFYQVLDTERKENLRRKKSLCDEAESLAESADWVPTAGRLKELQRRWKETGPVPREETDRLWRRFQAACNTFFERLEAAKPAHLARKQALCETVESLTASVSDENLKDTAHRIMALQEEWKEIGPVPEEAADALWERFHTPCDRFFDRYRGHVQEIRSKQAGNQEKKEAIVAEAESLAGSETWKETGERLKALQKAWKEIGPAPRRVEPALWERFRTACDRFFSRRNEFFAAQDRERSRKLAEKTEICLRLEVLAQLIAPDSAPDAGASDQAAERVRIGLAYREGVIVPGDRKTTSENVLKEVRHLQETWKRIGPVRGEADQRLWRRYREAAATFFPPKRSAPEE